MLKNLEMVKRDLVNKEMTMIDLERYLEDKNLCDNSVYDLISEDDTEINWTSCTMEDENTVEYLNIVFNVKDLENQIINVKEIELM